MRKSSKVLYIYLIAAMAILALAVAPSIIFANAGSRSAHAQDATYEVVFPTESYLQAQSPSLISANDKYLAVYDSLGKALFVRNEFDYSTHSYALSIDSATLLLTVGTHAFLQADDSYYTLDLDDKDATLQEHQLASPQNITSLCTDGTYLYAKSTGGNLSIYDENMSIAADFSDFDDYYNEDVLAGRAVMAAKDGQLYLFTATNENKPLLYVYDCRTKTKVYEGQTDLIQAAYIGDVIFAQISDIENYENRGQISCLDASTKQHLFVDELSPKSFYAYGSNLYAIDGAQVVVYTVSEERDSLNEAYTISMSGSDLSHLDAPSDAVQFGNRIAVADSNNDRVAFIDGDGHMTPVSLSASPKRLATDSKDVYALLDDGNLAKISSNGSVTNINGVGTTALDIAYTNNLYLLATDGIYALVTGRFIKICDLTGARRIACAEDSDLIYALSDDKITLIDGNGHILPTQLDGSFAEAKDIAVDYAGDIFAIYPQKVEKYHNTLTSLSLASSLDLSNTTVIANANSGYLMGQNLYFTADECLIGKAVTDAVDKTSYHGSTPDLSGSNASLIRLKEGVTSYVYPGDGRVGAASIATDETMLLLDYELGGGLGYALRKDVLYIVRTDDYDALAPVELSREENGTTYSYGTEAGKKLYSLPYIDSVGVTLEDTTIFERAYSLNGYDADKWLLVSYGGNNYYILRDDVHVGAEIYTPPADKLIKGRANADRVGGLVYIYSDSTLSNGICRIVDGTRIYVLQTYDGYYLVRYGDTVGYMRKDEVAINSLTTVQVVSIVLAIVVLLAGTGIFIAVYLTRKQTEEDNNVK